MTKWNKKQVEKIIKKLLLGWEFKLYNKTYIRFSNQYYISSRIGTNKPVTEQQMRSLIWKYRKTFTNKWNFLLEPKNKNKMVQLYEQYKNCTIGRATYIKKIDILLKLSNLSKFLEIEWKYLTRTINKESYQLKSENLFLEIVEA